MSRVIGLPEGVAAASSVARCKWCVARVGHPRFRLDGTWYDDMTSEVSESGRITDGICPECLDAEKRKLAQRKGEAGP